LLDSIFFLIMDIQNEKQRGGQEIEIEFTPDYKASEPIFWHAFKELSKNDDNGLVSYDRLQERLISTGKFHAGEAVLMIEGDKTLDLSNQLYTPLSCEST
jgi:hypothetical protein